MCGGGKGGCLYPVTVFLIMDRLILVQSYRFNLKFINSQWKYWSSPVHQFLINSFSHVWDIQSQSQSDAVIVRNDSVSFCTACLRLALWIFSMLCIHILLVYFKTCRCKWQSIMCICNASTTLELDTPTQVIFCLL